MNLFDLFKKKPVKTEDVRKNVESHTNESPQAAPSVKPESAHKSKESSQPAAPAPKDGKVHIYNLIIIDESGSMGHLRDATLSGVNETINTIRQAQQEFADKQSHFLTLVTFDSSSFNRESVRIHVDAKPIGEVSDFVGYRPCGGTPLFDAMGTSITRLHQTVKNDEDASAIVTVMTDGLENASREYSGRQIKSLIEQLKEEGWTFNYMGSAHDVKSVCDELSIDNVVEFSHDEAGTDEIWRKERMSKKRMFEQMNLDWETMKDCSAEEKREYRKRKSKGFFDGF